MNIEPLKNLSYCYRKLENYEDELSTLLTAKIIIDKNEIYSNDRFLIMINLANVYDYFGNRDEAIAIFENVFELVENKKLIGFNLDDDYYEAYYFYAETLYYNNKYQDSIKSIEKLPDEQKDSKKILELLANNYYYNEDYNQSIYFYNKALLKIDNEVEKISIYEYLAGSYQFLLDYDSAINIYIKIIDIAEREKLTEELITAYFRKGFCYYELKNNLSAIDAFNLGFIISGRPYFLERLAQCYENENKKNLAFQYYLEYANKVKAEEKSNEKDEIEAAIRNTIRLAKELDKFNELPEWIRKTI
jgi:tetratricopeptide (TPR) repeat protein